jgi:hypothetical protein
MTKSHTNPLRRPTPPGLTPLLTLALALSAFAGCASAPAARPAAPAEIVPAASASAEEVVEAVLASPELRRRLAAALHPDPPPPAPAEPETWEAELRALRLEVDVLKAAAQRSLRPEAPGEDPESPPLRVDPGADDVLERWLRRLDRDQDLIERRLRRLEQRLDRLERRPVLP